MGMRPDLKDTMRIDAGTGSSGSSPAKIGRQLSDPQQICAYGSNNRKVIHQLVSDSSVGLNPPKNIKSVDPRK